MDFTVVLAEYQLALLNNKQQYQGNLMKRFLAFLCLFILNISLSHAAVTINIVESGANVVATATGSLDLTGSSLVGSTPNGLFFGVIQGSSAAPGSTDTFLSIGTGTGSRTYIASPTSVVLSTGPYVAANSNTGTSITIVSSDPGTFDDHFTVPFGYISGDPINSSSTWAGHTIASLQLIPGSYNFALAADSFTINIGPIAPTTFTVGGTVSGLIGSVTLQNNSSDDIIKTTNDGFTFPAQAEGTGYAVTVSSQPTGQTCSVTDGSGTIATADVTNVSVACIDDVVAPPPVPMAPIPTLSQWALILLTMLLGLMVFANRRRLF
jgi:hypothetical protein